MCYIMKALVGGKFERQTADTAEDSSLLMTAVALVVVVTIYMSHLGIRQCKVRTDCGQLRGHLVV